MCKNADIELIAISDKWSLNLYNPIINSVVSAPAVKLIINPGVNALRTPVYTEMVNIVNNNPVTFSDYKFEEDKVRNVFNTDNFSEVNNSTANDLQNIQKEVLKMGFSMLNTATPFIYCEANSDTNTFHLLPDLSIWKCCSDLEDFDSCIGQMKDDGTIKFDAEKLIKWYNACNFNSNSHCLQCKNLPDCLGGCPKYNQKHGKRRCDKEYMLNYRYMERGR